ncbi:polysaccharide biosynthesis tyrosine autokinase [Mucilaginibacter corticis]|uniref:non-specific protein-tyrosine kinase n=1 Tax=Mucilaginibacter corticis TaxID=2597670 RepID=A0A556M7R4_9SPHI|nr:tyrosine-protein kinase family protein [Mucilaginibacter corticis]TSJ35953.1 polysaccharide biosynthesis tyrosine autokinase [Mucilaginibacter corticis]
MKETENIPHKLPSQEIDYFKIAKILLSRWYWIVGSVLLAVLFSNVYLWYTPKTYATSGTMKFEEKKSEISDIAGAVTTSDKGPSKVQTETMVLQSRNVVISAIRDMDYRVSFYVVGRVLNRTNELYPQKPLDIEFLKFDTANFFHDLVSFKPVNNSSFSLSYPEYGKQVEKVISYNAPFTLGSTALRIKRPAGLLKNVVYQFKFNAPEDFLDRVRGGLHTSEIIRNSNIVSIQQTDANPQFAADALNAVMTEYLNYDRYQRMQSATQMISFIDTQLKYLSGQVKGSEKSIEKFKQNLKIMDVGSAAEAALSKAKELESQNSLLKIQLIALDQLKADILKEKNNVTLNFNLEGVVDPLLQTSIVKLDALIADKYSLLKTYTDNSGPVNDINQQILRIKNSALSNIETSIALVKKNMAYITDQQKPLAQQIAQFPVAENDMAGLKRNFEVNDKVYSFLSERKLNAQISRSGILPGATILDVAQPNYAPVAPDEHSIRRSAIIAGLLIGFGLIILIRVLNPYIYDKETIESLTAIPILGVIRKFPEPIDEYSSQILAISRPKSIFAESVRSVRTNLNFLAADKTRKVICVTSEVAGEGKSFVAVNLSSTLSLIDKKVILIAADLRRSKLHKTFQVPNDIGLSNYLAHQCTADDIIKNSSLSNLDFIVSGPVPPNPSELLHSARVGELIALLKTRYEVIMIDTAPIGLVSDSIPLIRLSDINLFVIRSGKSKFYSATVPQRIAHEYQLDNTVIVLNAYAEDLLHSRYYNTKFTGEGNGSKYYYYSDYTGYGNSEYYVDDPKNKWWNVRRWFK